MTREVLDLIKNMDLKAAEKQVVLRCAPMIMGLKPSNLLVLKQGEERCVQQLFENTRFSCCRLYCAGREAVLLVYEPLLLMRTLAVPKARKMLCQHGYREFAFDALLDRLAGRYLAYRRQMGAFPHEMGLFLGYPPEDVQGFLDNGGRHALCAGYWKVYQEKAKKIRLFRSFDQAGERLLRFLADGAELSEVLERA